MHGLFLAMQYPAEVPGVKVGDLVTAAVRARGGDADAAALAIRLAHEAERLEIGDEFLARGVNSEFSGGEKKRMETLQLAVLEPKFAVLDEIDSGLDVDALRDVSRRVEAMTTRRRSACSRSPTTRVCSPSCVPTACTSSLRVGS